MNNPLLNEILLIVAVLTTGIVYGTDSFHAIAGKKATSLSKDASIADLLGHTHLVADKRMPVIGMISIISTAIFLFLNLTNLTLVICSGITLITLLAHLTLYLKVAKPVNSLMSAAAVNNKVPANIRDLQNKWDSVIFYRTTFLTIAILGLLISIMNL